MGVALKALYLIVEVDAKYRSRCELVVDAR